MSLSSIISKIDNDACNLDTYEDVLCLLKNGENISKLMVCAITNNNNDIIKFMLNNGYVPSKDSCLLKYTCFDIKKLLIQYEEAGHDLH